MEMQNFPEKHFFKRTLFYLSRLYTEGLKKGGGYNQLPDTYLLILTNFTLFQQTGDYYSSFSFRRDEKPHFMFHRALRVVTVELNKFPRKRISALFDLKEQWCYMLKRSDRMREEELNHLGERSKDMKEVTDHFKELSASEQRRFLEEHRQKSEWVFHNQKEYARDEGRAEGLKQGREEGMKQGMKQVALQMLKEKADIGFIARVTGITKERVLKLKAEID